MPEVWVGKFSQEMLDEKTAATLNDLRQQLKPTKEPVDLGWIEELLECPTTQIYVVSVDGFIVGVGLLCFMKVLEGRQDFLQELVVNKQVRGLGYGDLLLEAIIKRSLDDNALHLSFTTEAVREAALKLYKSKGFEHRKDKMFFRLDP